MTVKIERNIYLRFRSDLSPGKCGENDLLKFLNYYVNNKKYIYII